MVGTRRVNEKDKKDRKKERSNKGKERMVEGD